MGIQGWKKYLSLWEKLAVWALFLHRPIKPLGSFFFFMHSTEKCTRVKIKVGTPAKSNESRNTSKLFFKIILVLISLNRAYIPLYTPIVKPEPSLKSEFSKTKNGLKNGFTEMHFVFDFLKFRFYSLLDFDSWKIKGNLSPI